MIWPVLFGVLACPSTGSEETASASPDSGIVADCDPTITRYVDADGDGYGAETTTADCDGVEFSGDCDDADAAVHPYAGDVCANGVDEDCSGTDRLCGGSEVGDAAVTLALDERAVFSGHRAVASATSPDESAHLLLGSRVFGYVGAFALRSGHSDATSALAATWTQADGVGTDFLWDEWVVWLDGNEPVLFAAYEPPFEGQRHGVRRFESPWVGDRLDTDADAMWESDGAAHGLYVAPAASVDGADRIFFLEGPEPGVAYLIPPDAPSGLLSAVAATQVEGGWLRPAGDMDGDGLNDSIAYWDEDRSRTHGAVYGPIGEGVLAFADLLDREWHVGNDPAPVGDLDGDGLADIAHTTETDVDWGVFERRVSIFAGDAASGSPTDAAWLTVQSNPCGEYWYYEDYAGMYTGSYCEDALRPVGVGDLDGNGTDDLVIQGVFPTSDDATSGAVVLFDGGAGVVDLADGSATGQVWIDPGEGGEWQPTATGGDLPHQGAFSTDFDSDGVLDLFFFGYFDDSAPAPGNYLYGFRGPIE